MSFSFVLNVIHYDVFNKMEVDRIGGKMCVWASKTNTNSKTRHHLRSVRKCFLLTEIPVGRGVTCTQTVWVCSSLCKLTVASLQTPHLTTCWWILPSTEIRL